MKNLLAPEISITNPSVWSTVQGSVSIEAQTSHSSGINRVEFHIDEVLRSTDYSTAYSYTWDTTSEEEDSHKLRARAYNNNGKSSDVEMDVLVQNGVPSYRLTMAAGAGGTTDPAPGDHYYVVGTPVDVEAIPDIGFDFSQWTGDVPSGQENNNPITITMDIHKSINASFDISAFRDDILATWDGSGVWYKD
jgi:hypothetical protein